MSPTQLKKTGPPMPELTRFYINNVPYLFDPERQTFTHESDRTATLTQDDVRDTSRYHVAQLEIVDISGTLYYHEPDWKQFRRVGPPYDTLSFDAFTTQAAEGSAVLTNVESDTLLNRLVHQPPAHDQTVPQPEKANSRRR